jgi:hypothetical protein
MFDDGRGLAGLLAWCSGDEPETGLAVLELLERLAAADPGPPVIAALAAFDPAELGADERVVWLAGWERQGHWLAGRAQDGLVAVGGAAPSADDWAREEIAAAVRLSPGAAQLRLAVARELTGRLAATGAALRAGRISYPHARALADAVADLDDPAARDVQARVLPAAECQTPGRFRRTVERAVAAADPDRAEQDHRRAAADRRVELFADPHGMATLWALLPAPDAHTVWQSLDAIAAAAAPDDPRGIDARRADALVALATNAAGRPPVPRICVTVGLPTLLGLADTPGELAGHGPIPASLARALAADGVWRRLVTDPLTGDLLDYGRASYRPPAPLVAFLRARHPHCAFPGCPRPAHRCDIDHTTPWDAGGTTDRANCRPLCRRHHRLKTHAGWTITPHPDGGATWTSPTGRRYTTPAAGYPPDG